MRSVAIAACVLALASVSCVSLADDECRHTAPRDAAIDADGARSVRLVARAGTLRVDGRPGLSRVEASGTACSSDPELLEKIELAARRAGDEVVIEVRIPETEGWMTRAALDLTVEVPADLPLEVDDTSGSLEIRNVAALRLTDGSGDIWIEDVAGALSVVDGSGGIEIARVGGDVTIEDGSGEIGLADVTGSVEIEDGSGGIEVRRVGHDVVISEDGSGGIDVAEVEGSLLVRDDGSGSISATDVRGDFVVENDGSGSIRHSGIGGRVSVPAD